MQKIKLIKNDKGVTLVELLATLVIVSIIGTLSYSVLSQGYSNYQRIQAETQLRDEADLIMASMIKDLFVLKQSGIDEVIEDCSGTAEDSYIKLKNSSYKIGFEGNKVFANGQEVKFYNDTIKLLPNNCADDPPSPTYIEKSANKGEYNIVFTLETQKGNTAHTMQFKNTVQVIDDLKGDLNEEAN